MNQADNSRSSRRGRPRGSRTQVLRDDGALGRHHFAFLRAWLQGLDVKAAWLRYLAFAEDSDDLRHIERRRRELLHRVLRDAAAMALLPSKQRPAGWTANFATDAARLLGKLDTAPITRTLPSLDEFIAQHGADPDQFSQAEWLEEYQAHFGLNQPLGDDAWRDNDSSPEARRAQLQALRQLEHGLARQPRDTDAVERWFSPRTLPLLSAAGTRTLGALLDRIDQRGAAWFKPIRGLGTRRAHAIVAWLTPLAENWGRPLRALDRRSGSGALSQPAVGASGASRFSRQVLDNASAIGDLTAVRRWLERHSPSPATLRAYTKESERFLLWCLHLSGKPVLSIDAADCVAYCRFLAEVPTDWIEPHALSRGHPAWKPFRGPLKPASQRHALAVVQALFDALRESNPDLTNPMAEARRREASVESPVTTGRSISGPDWTWLLAQIDRTEAKALVRQPGSTMLRAGAVQRRLRLILCLLRSTGLRLSELVTATTADVCIATPDGAGMAAGFITVHGSGARQRKLPLMGDVLRLLADHHADAAALGALPCPAPIICTLRPELSSRPTVPLTSGTSSTVLGAPGMSPDHRRLGANGVYRLLKRFFARASAQAQAVDAARGERVLAASTHWLRHTFGEQGIADGMSMTALQQALGHASPGSTRRYGKARESSTEPRAPDPEKGEGVGRSNPLRHEST